MTTRATFLCVLVLGTLAASGDGTDAQGVLGFGLIGGRARDVDWRPMRVCQPDEVVFWDSCRETVALPRLQTRGFPLIHRCRDILLGRSCCNGPMPACTAPVHESHGGACFDIACEGPYHRKDLMRLETPSMEPAHVCVPDLPPLADYGRVQAVLADHPPRVTPEAMREGWHAASPPTLFAAPPLPPTVGDRTISASTPPSRTPATPVHLPPRPVVEQVRPLPLLD